MVQFDFYASLSVRIRLGIGGGQEWQAEEEKPHRSGN